LSELRQDLTALVDGELTEDQRLRIQNAITADDELGQEFRELNQVAQVLRTEIIDPPVTGFAETLAAIRAGTPRTAEAKANRPWVLIGQFAVVTAIGGLFLFSAFWNVNPPSGDRNVASMEKQVASDPAFASRAVSSAARAPETSLPKSVISPRSGTFSNPQLGPVLPPSNFTEAAPIASRAPGSGERPLLALRDAESDSATGSTSPPSSFRAMAGNIPTQVFPLEVEPLPPVAGQANNSGLGATGTGKPASLAMLEATVRTLVSSSKGSITGTSRTADGSRIVITVDEATADSLTRNIESVLGANVSIEPIPTAPPVMASAKAAVAARAVPKADASDAELTLSQLEKRLADQQAKREELLKDFYEDAKPVKSLDAEIQDTKSQIERKKRATKANKLNFVVILKPVKQ